MGRVVVIGEEVAVCGYALAGAVVLGAQGEAAVRDRWAELASDVEVVILTAAAAEILAEQRVRAGAPLTVVMPR